jgi:hypothetical protein
MFLVVLHWFSDIKDDFCIVTETKEKAEEWIEKDMGESKYNGLGVHKIILIELYK